jgi:hypothetical protein
MSAMTSADGTPAPIMIPRIVCRMPSLASRGAYFRSNGFCAPCFSAARPSHLASHKQAKNNLLHRLTLRYRRPNGTTSIHATWPNSIKESADTLGPHTARRQQYACVVAIRHPNVACSYPVRFRLNEAVESATFEKFQSRHH